MNAPQYPHVEPALIQRAREILANELETFRERTPRSAQWLADAERAMPGGVPMAWMRSLYRHAPVVAVRGSGSRFTDLDDNTYLDFNDGLEKMVPPGTYLQSLGYTVGT